jgi:hypothetical protein
LHKNILVIHLYKYTIVSKNKFILHIRSFYNILIVFFVLTKKGMDITSSPTPPINPENFRDWREMERVRGSPHRQ